MHLEDPAADRMPHVSLSVDPIPQDLERDLDQAGPVQVTVDVTSNDNILSQSV